MLVGGKTAIAVAMAVGSLCAVPASAGATAAGASLTGINGEGSYDEAVDAWFEENPDLAETLRGES